jgi:beta-mannosidase
MGLAVLSSDVFLLDLVLSLGDGGVASQNRYVMSRTADLAPLLHLEPAEVVVDADTSNDEVWRLRLRHAGGPAAVGLVVEDDRPTDTPGWAVLGDNVLDLLPGEARTVDVEWRDAPQHERRLLVAGWNVEAVRVG